MGATAVLQFAAWKLVLAKSEFQGDELKVVCPDVSPTSAETANQVFDLLDKKLDHKLSVGRKADETSALMGSFPELRGVLGPESPTPRLLVSTIGRRRYAPPLEGAPGPHPDTSSYLKMVAESTYYLRNHGHLGHEQIFSHLPQQEYAEANRTLYEAGIVADVARHAINAKGECAPGFLEKTSVSVTLPTMRRWRSAGTVAVAACGGSRMLHAFRAAMKTRAFSAAIIDSALAIQLIPPSKRPAMYRSSPVFRLPELVEDPDPRTAYESVGEAPGMISP
jgi:hypothetical protein